MCVSVSTHGNTAVVTIDYPPVNAIGLEVRKGLIDAVERTESDPSINAVVLICAGKSFVAGADVREFDKPPVEPHLPDVLLRIENSTKPWIAAIHGAALGGGLELAMACHQRIANQSAKLGLPEVTLGVIPGAGGTVRLPRLVDAATALNMIATGKPLNAQRALEAGLLDAVSNNDLLPDAIALAQTIPAALATLKKPTKLPADPQRFQSAIDTILKKAGGQTAPKVAIQALNNAYQLDAIIALRLEREAFLSLRSAPQAAAMRHIFFAERSTAKVERVKHIAPNPVKTVGVVGGGTMGAGIAAACLLAGLEVTMVERDESACKAGYDRVHNTLETSLKRGLIDQLTFDKLLRTFGVGTQYSILAKADLVIEAVFEDLDVKQQVFAQLDKATHPAAILATNTSYLDVAAIASVTTDPTRVIGLHFFSPAHIMKLLEVVVPDCSSDHTVATALSFARKLGKVPVLAGICDGFIANRIMSAYRREAEYMIEDGAMPWEVDKAMTDFGMPMGIFQMGDLAGLDISWAMRKRQATTRDPNQRYVDIGDKLYALGRLGRKTGKGYYRYDTGKPTPDPDVEALIMAESHRKGIIRQAIDPDTIMARILSAMQREGQKILKEGIAQSAADIDVVMVNAYGFPRWRGGPMYMLDREVSL
ncbi:MAG: enoyl-CoA hydratase/isomerase family protein [Gammaproteobacteria bacterium]|nr:enoyl-CoA hydratase/isomerase family protein [Gammaproteobacteria bacterium]